MCAVNSLGFFHLDKGNACETRVNLVDNELLREMKKSGCYLIAYGIESGNQKILITFLN